MFLKIVLIYVPIFVVCYYFLPIVKPPSNFPKNIPTIPFYVSFLGLFTNLDQKEIFEIHLREKLEKFGAVKIYFASRWNILVTKPEYLQQVFADEDTFAKSGNHIKIPYSILSDYTGDNIISAHGKVWKLYRDVLAQSIQFPNWDPVMSNSMKLVWKLKEQIKQVGSIIPVGDAVQQFSLANIGDSMLGIDLKLLSNEKSVLNERLKAVKSQIFKPFYLNFPYLDKFPIPSRVKARKQVQEFRNYYFSLIKSNHSELNNAANKLIEALKDGILTEKQFGDNAMIIMVAGHENPQLLLTSLLYVLAKYPNVQNKLRDELALNQFNEANLDELPYLSSVIYETLRMFPPLGQIINRKTTKSVMLGDIKIPAGTYVGYNNFATGRDRLVWNNADNFDPGRWGNTLDQVSKNYLKAKSSARLPAFHGRKRACLGEKFALFEMKQALNQLLKSFVIERSEHWEEKLTPGGPVSPLKLELKFKMI